MDIAADQRNWLHTLQSLSKRPLKVSKNVNGKPTKWVSLEDVEFPVDLSVDVCMLVFSSVVLAICVMKKILPRLEIIEQK